MACEPWARIRTNAGSLRARAGRCSPATFTTPPLGPGVRLDDSRDSLDAYNPAPSSPTIPA